MLDIKGAFWGLWEFFFFTIHHQIHNRLIVFFGDFFLVFSLRKRIFCSKSLKELKVQKWCQNGSNSIIWGVMSNVWYCEIQKSDLLGSIWWSHRKYGRKFRVYGFLKNAISPFFFWHKIKFKLDWWQFFFFTIYHHIHTRMIFFFF